ALRLTAKPETLTFEQAHWRVAESGRTWFSLCDNQHTVPTFYANDTARGRRATLLGQTRLLQTNGALHETSTVLS
ncbi:MAG: hypothetical protein RLZZ481_760, partial [Pseudomonadota bacterium]